MAFNPTFIVYRPTGNAFYTYTFSYDEAGNPVKVVPVESPAEAGAFELREEFLEHSVGLARSEQHIKFYDFYEIGAVYFNNYEWSLPVMVLDCCSLLPREFALDTVKFLP
jgi:hypothetical protein